MSRSEPDFSPTECVTRFSPLWLHSSGRFFFSSVTIFASKSFQGEITSWDHLAIIKLGISFLPSTCQRNPREKTTQVWTTCVFPSARLQVCTPWPGLDLTQNVPPSICDGLLTLWLWESKRTQLILGRSRHNLTLCLMTESCVPHLCHGLMPGVTLTWSILLHWGGHDLAPKSQFTHWNSPLRMNGTEVPSYSAATAIYELEPGKLRSQTAEHSGPLQEPLLNHFLLWSQGRASNVLYVGSEVQTLSKLSMYFNKTINSSTRNCPSFPEKGLGKCINSPYLSVTISSSSKQ